jgi:hypothetical protein
MPAEVTIFSFACVCGADHAQFTWIGEWRREGNIVAMETCVLTLTAPPLSSLEIEQRSTERALDRRFVPRQLGKLVTSTCWGDHEHTGVKLIGLDALKSPIAVTRLGWRDHSAKQSCGMHFSPPASEMISR